MANENFMRRYIMKCGQMEQTGFQIGNISSAREDALHIYFSIEKSDSETPNDAKVQIWNLSNENLKILEMDNTVVELMAGYGDTMSLVLVGNVSSAITTLSNGDRLTELSVVDGMVELQDAHISISMNGSVYGKDVYEKIAEAMGMPIMYAEDLKFLTIPYGFSYVGTAKNGLKKIADFCGHNWTIQNKVIQITMPNRPINSTGYLLSKETGLIGAPSRITIGSGSEVTNGWEVEYFLNGAIGINDVVQLESPTVSGYFRVHKITFDGDNLEGDWVCVAQLLDIAVNTQLDAQASANTSASSGGTIKVGDEVKVIRTFVEGGKTKGYQYAGGTFVCWYSTYDVIRINGDRVVIGIGSVVTTAIHINDLAKV